MKSKDYFIVGCKLYGIYCLLLGIASIGGAISTFTSKGDIPIEIYQAYFLTNIILRLTPILFIGSGWYLLVGGKKIYEFAYPREEKEQNNFKEIFILSLKIFGIYLIVSNFPELIRNASEFVTHMTAPEIFQAFSQQQFNISNTISCISGFLLGLYLLRSGKLFIKYGLEKS